MDSLQDKQYIWRVNGKRYGQWKGGCFLIADEEKRTGGRKKMIHILAVGAGGFLGAVCRYLIGLIPVNEAFLFPIKTLMINILGCIAIGLITVAAAKNHNIHPLIILFLKAGVCGGFTTFSTFALETTDLMKAGHTLMAFTYSVLSVVAGVSMIFMITYFLMGRS